ncbi:MAG: cysteine--tRNA ligase [Elusimicrobia bacterium]|nr:cysteine--tRNA ligase [Elusimicrobiota bacterium]
MKIFNTISKKKEEFKPLKKNKVTMYVCGITPYDEVHLGHARAYVTFDVIRRHFINSGYKVTYIQNFTDIDDKIIKRANELKVSPKKLAEKNIENYFLQIGKLNVLSADKYPKVTEYIPQIIKFIKKLIKKGAAYILDGDVYFSVRNFPDYGKLSKRNIEDLKSGARVEIDENKKDPLDFALWKKSKPEEPAEVSFDSPWGKGRPGWHIECSVMSTTILGDTIDIHGGGQDLIFPHHENEIAQTETATGKPFVRYWIHNGFVTINKEKMSKSLGNFFTLKDIFEKYEPRVVRYFLLSQHYRSPIDFSEEKLLAAKNALAGLDNTSIKLKTMFTNIGDLPSKEELSDEKSKAKSSFLEALDNDFNTENALSELHKLKYEMHGNPDRAFYNKAYNTLKMLMEKYIGIPLRESEAIPEKVITLLSQREEFRKQKDWKKSDQVRKQIEQLGYGIEDNPNAKSTAYKKI